jgi:hypothetical protein
MQFLGVATVGITAKDCLASCLFCVKKGNVGEKKSERRVREQNDNTHRPFEFGIIRFTQKHPKAQKSTQKKLETPNKS